VVEVTAQDDTDSSIFPRGKQSNEPGGVWYTPTSGIWQSVWLENVPDDGYIKSIKLEPDFDKQELKIEAEFVGNKAFANVEAYYHGQLVARGTFDPSGECVLDFNYSFYPWTPEEPNLYELVFTAGYDTVRSYFAMRKFTKVKIGDYYFFALNNKPYFLTGVLDQGYWPESGMTPPSDAAILFDLQLLKKCGFNFVRKHATIEPMRWYSHLRPAGVIGDARLRERGLALLFFLDSHPADFPFRYLGYGSQETGSAHRRIAQSIPERYEERDRSAPKRQLASWAGRSSTKAGANSTAPL
jgi:hypothetical protein